MPQHKCDISYSRHYNSTASLILILLLLQPQHRCVCQPTVLISRTQSKLFTYGEFKAYWFGSYRWIHHGNFKQRCKQQKLLFLSHKTLRTKKEDWKTVRTRVAGNQSHSLFATWNTSSSATLVSHGVPQSSVLGLILFCLILNISLTWVDNK